MANPRVGIVLGSKSDLPQMEGAEALLKELSVPYELRIISAHRTPDESAEYAKTAKDRGLEVVIGMAGMAAHLAGVLAAHCKVPVLGVPAQGGALNGVDALYSTAQMPAGVPVACFAIGKAGATNAALFACQIMMANDADLAERVANHRAAMQDKIRADDAEVQNR
jgi:phosphoribosylaminoimidazole carboxylase PurE protein